MLYPRIGFLAEGEIIYNLHAREAFVHFIRDCHLLTPSNILSGLFYVIHPQFQSLYTFTRRPSGYRILNYTNFAQELLEFVTEVKKFCCSLNVGDTVIVEGSVQDSTNYPMRQSLYIEKPIVGTITDIVDDVLTEDDKRKRFYNGDDRVYYVKPLNRYILSCHFQLPTKDTVSINTQTLILEDLNIII